MRVEASKNRLIWVRPRSVEVFLALAADFHRLIGLVEKQGDILMGKPLDAEEMAMGEEDHAVCLLTGAAFSRENARNARMLIRALPFAVNTPQECRGIRSCAL